MSTRVAARSGQLIGTLALVALMLTACTAPTEPAPTSPPIGSPSSAPVESAEPVALVPGGTAEQNLPFFQQVLQASAGSDPETPGRDVADALIAAGFPREAMQLTADETSIGLAADSVQISVRMTDSCLLGQYGPKVEGVLAVVAAPIATGACLVGRTVPVD